MNARILIAAVAGLGLGAAVVVFAVNPDASEDDPPTANDSTEPTSTPTTDPTPSLTELHQQTRRRTLAGPVGTSLI